jgi:hypothetical protein
MPTKAKPAQAAPLTAALTVEQRQAITRNLPKGVAHNHTLKVAKAYNATADHNQVCWQAVKAGITAGCNVGQLLHHAKAGTTPAVAPLAANLKFVSYLIRRGWLVNVDPNAT